MPGAPGCRARAGRRATGTVDAATGVVGTSWPRRCRVGYAHGCRGSNPPAIRAALIRRVVGDACWWVPMGVPLPNRQSDLSDPTAKRSRTDTGFPWTLGGAARTPPSQQTPAVMMLIVAAPGGGHRPESAAASDFVAGLAAGPAG